MLIRNSVIRAGESEAPSTIPRRRLNTQRDAKVIFIIFGSNLSPRRIFIVLFVAILPSSR